MSTKKKTKIKGRKPSAEARAAHRKLEMAHRKLEMHLSNVTKQIKALRDGFYFCN